MSNPESRFTANLNKDVEKLNHMNYTWKIMTYGNNGLPDCYASGMSGDIWYENKWITLPKRETTKIVPNLSPLQQNWLTAQDMRGRNVAVIIGSKEGCCIIHNTTHSIEQGQLTRKDFTFTRKEVAQWIHDQIND